MNSRKLTASATALILPLAAALAVLLLMPVIRVSAHADYDWAAIVREAPLVIDTRNATGGLPPSPHVIRL